MFYNVVVRDAVIPMEGNELVFTFYDLDEAIEFGKKILSISKHSIEIL